MTMVGDNMLPVSLSGLVTAINDLTAASENLKDNLSAVHDMLVPLGNIHNTVSELTDTVRSLDGLADTISDLTNAVATLQSGEAQQEANTLDISELSGRVDSIEAVTDEFFG